MREILFRGKRKDNGEWVYGWYAPLVCNDKTIIPCIRNKNGTDKEVIPETVEQCTGLSEKVEEIKKALQDHSIEKLKYQDGIKIKELDFFDILTYINELESENKSLQDLCNKAYKELNRRNKNDKERVY